MAEGGAHPSESETEGKKEQPLLESEEYSSRRRKKRAKDEKVEYLFTVEQILIEKRCFS